MDESMVMVCMQIITNTGSAKSSYIEAIQKAKKGDLGGAEISMNEGDFPDPYACRRSDGKYGNGQGNGKGVY